MTKRVQEVALGTRTARLRLAGRHKPYFRLVSAGQLLGLPAWTAISAGNLAHSLMLPTRCGLVSSQLMQTMRAIAPLAQRR
jgi:hypothetical protein